MKKLISLLLTLTMILALTACGAKETGKSQDESDLNYVKSKGKLIIGYTNYAPMNYTDENGVFTGFDTELAILTCEKLGVEPEFVEINWDTKEVELNANPLTVLEWIDN